MGARSNQVGCVSGCMHTTVTQCPLNLELEYSFALCFHSLWAKLLIWS
uniref:Uncharacterized protein n=1 Tax=Arundo donax TaxID=35708 RepID=A0A0A8YGX5_ARUDO